MADRKSISPLALLLLGLGGAAVVYAVMQPAVGTGTNTQIPNGAVLNSQWGTWTNTTGQPVWVTATGILVNGAGDLLGNIKDLITALNQGGGSSGDGSGGVGKRKAIGNSQPGAYYNPLPGGLL